MFHNFSGNMEDVLHKMGRRKNSVGHQAVILHRISIRVCFDGSWGPCLHPKSRKSGNHDFGHERGRRESYGRKNTDILHGISSRIQWDHSWTSKTRFCARRAGTQKTTFPAEKIADDLRADLCARSSGVL